MLSDVYATVPRFRIHMQRQNGSVDEYKAELGLNGGEVAELHEDAALCEWIPDFCDEMNDCKETANGVKTRFFSSEEDTPAGKFKNAPDATPPFEIKSGAMARAKRRDKKMLAFNPSEAAMIAMDLHGDADSSLSPDTIKPATVFTILEQAYSFETTIRDKGEADMSEVQIRRLGQEKWQTVKSGTGRTLTATVEPTEPGKSERLEARVRLFRKNEPYGQPSDPQYITLNP